MKYTALLLFCLGLIASVFFGQRLYQDVMQRKVLKEDLAEINRVNYELFNVEIWKQEALGIFQNRIKEFGISESTYVVLDEQVQGYLHSMYQRYFESGELIDMIVDNLEKGGKMNKMFLNLIKTNVVEQLDQLDLKSQIPGLSKQIIAEVRQNEPLLREYMQKELLRLIVDDAARSYVDRRVPIYQRYGFVALEDTETHLTEAISEMDRSISDQTNYFLWGLATTILMCIMVYKVNFEWSVAGLTLVSILLLLLGISLPMIDIDARLDSFVFSLLGEDIVFDEQVIYFQSKSIVEVTKTLWQSGGADLKAVGALVLMFSIVFPFFKLLLSALYLFSDKVKNNRVAQQIIFHLGKWSMADVFVVAIFMAYIGMYGVITSQLSAIDQNQGGFAIETLNYSRLSPGAFYFTSYTILSIVIGILINRRAKTE